MAKTSDAIDTLLRCVADVRAVSRFMIEVLDLQLLEHPLRRSERATQLVRETRETLASHLQHLDDLLTREDAPRSALHESTSHMAGAFFGFFSKCRAHEPAKILRDDHSLLTFAANTYLTLHTSAVALRHGPIADVAMAHYRELEPLLRSIEHALPKIVMEGLQDRFAGLNPEAAETTVRLASEVTPFLRSVAEIA